jgi:polyisoprenyl-teichoic acid--peptidoglycan teichoic acid transferase
MTLQALAWRQFMHTKPIFVWLLLLCLPACGRMPAIQSPPPPTVTPAVNPTQTQTPFQPEGVSGFDGSTSSLPTQVVVPSGDVSPAQAEPLPLPYGEVNILLLGSDQRPEHSDFRTDVIVLISLRPNGSISLVSFPRDLYINLPGWGMSRINAAYEYGGFELLARALDYNFGLRPQHFILTNFDGFRTVVDSLGGVDVLAGQALSDARTGFPDGFSVSAGWVHMDGETALWYIRSRGTSNDFDRLRRAQEVLVGIGQKLLSVQGLLHVPELYQAFQSFVATDLTLDGVLNLLPLLQAIDPGRIDRFALAPPLVIPWIEPGSGAYYLLPDPVSIRALLEQAVGIP